MLMLMILRASHTSMATMFLVKALEKLSLGANSSELLLLVSSSRGPGEVEFIINISSVSEGNGDQSAPLFIRNNL